MEMYDEQGFDAIDRGLRRMLPDSFGDEEFVEFEE